MVLAGEVGEAKLVGEVEVGNTLAELGGVDFGGVCQADDGGVLIGEAVEVGAKTEHAACVLDDTETFVVAYLEAKGVGEGFT